MSGWVDMLERPLAKDDYVVYFGNIYQIVDLLDMRQAGGLARILLIDKNKTTRSVKKNCNEMCKIDKEDVLIWKLKRDY